MNVIVSDHYRLRGGLGHDPRLPSDPRPNTPPDRDSAAKSWARALANIAPLRRGETTSLGSIIDGLADRFGDRPALAAPHTVLTYRGLRERKSQYANWAQQAGISPGTVVGLLMGNRPDYAALWIGLSQIGVVVALINTSLTGEPLAHAIRAAAAAHIIVDGALAGVLDAVRPALPATILYWAFGSSAATAPGWRCLDTAAYPATAPCAPDGGGLRSNDTALLIYTSGTTGLPKAALVSHYRVLEWSLWFAGMMNAGPDDRLYDCLPLYHSTGGVAGLGAMLVSGGCVELRPRFSASRFWQDVTQSGCTIFLYIGELCRYLVNAPSGAYDNRHSLRLCVGNGLRADVWQAFTERFRIAQVLEFYASTEGNVSLYNCEGRPGAIGRVPPFLARLFPLALIACDTATGEPLRGKDGRCIRCAPGSIGEAIGEISGSLRTDPASFDGYTDAAASDRKILRHVFKHGDRWFRTGDLMVQDAQQFFYFVDRLGDTFRWKGENVSTTEVSAALCRCRGISNAVVYGVQVAGTEGRAGMAAVTVTEDFDPHQLHEDIAARLPAHARPLFVRVCASLPTTGTFKPVKTTLAEQGFANVPPQDPLYVADASAGTYRLLSREGGLGEQCLPPQTPRHSCERRPIDDGWSGAGGTPHPAFTPYYPHQPST